jgi:transglutaminase-like putative cysteine protease
MLPELELREGWVTVICLLLMSLCVSWAYQTAQWVEGMVILQAVVLVGTCVGIVLAKSNIRGRLAHLVSLLAGWTWATYLTAQVLSRSAEIPQDMAVIQLEAYFRDLFLVPFNEGATADNHVFLFLLAFLMWLLAYFAAWAVFRRQQVWWAIILWGAALLINMTYAQANLTVYLIVFLLASLLLVVRASLALYEQEWREAHVNYSSELIAGFLRAGLVISFIVILLAWVAPVALASRPLQPFWDKLGEPWRRLQEESSRIFQDLNYQNEPPLVYLGDRRMWFGGPVRLEDTPIADVEAVAGRYWRVMVFHDYTSDGWVSNDPDTILIGENEQDLAAPTLDLRVEVTQTLTVLRDWATGDALIAAAQPLRSGLPLRASVSFLTLPETEAEQSADTADLTPPPADATELPDPTLSPADATASPEPTASPPEPTPFPPAPGDPSAIYSQRSLVAGASYQVLSSMSVVDQESLREAGTDYPDWVVPRYLQLPDSLPERVRLLAEQLTEGLDSPFDKALAIERTLRRIPYDDQIEGPGLRQDGVDYFLFEARAGYCDYYASAMVVMLRSVGVPSRYVRGYSEGEAEDGIYHLLESDGHAWPEVYFPGYGWIEFEPTGGEPALIRPRSQEPDDPDSAANQNRPFFDRDTDILPDDFERRFDIIMPTPEPETFLQKVARLGPIALIVAALATILALVLVILRRRQIAGLSVAERVYEDLVAWVRRLLRIEPLAHQTPNEFAGVVAQQVPKGQSAVEQIASLYVRERFSGNPVSGGDAESAWSEARSAIWRRWFSLRFDAITRFWRVLVPAKPSPPPDEMDGSPE